MASDIEWTRGDDGAKGETWNPAVSGCSLASPGCEKCYAMKQAHRFSGPTGIARYRGLTVIGKHGPRWTGEVRITNDNLDAPLRWKKPRRIFVNSMTDLFHADVPNETIAAVFGVMAACPQHTFQILTKRAERLPQWFEWAAKRGEDGLSIFPDDPLDWRIRQMLNVAARKAGADVGSNHGGPWPLPNVHLGVSVENQEYADKRIARLLDPRVRAAVLFLSVEPLLGPVDLARINLAPLPNDELGERWDVLEMGIDWVIVGGESGPGARPCDIGWIRAIVSQCRAAEVPCFVKQLGANPTEGYQDPANYGPMIRLKSRKGGDMAEWPSDLRVREFPVSGGAK